MEITIICRGCKTALVENGVLYHRPGEVYVEPCETCMADARSSGHRDGYDEGTSEGYDAGLAEGERAVRDDVKAMMTLVKEESCAELKDGAVNRRASS